MLDWLYKGAAASSHVQDHPSRCFALCVRYGETVQVNSRRGVWWTGMFPANIGFYRATRGV